MKTNLRTSRMTLFVILLIPAAALASDHNFVCETVRRILCVEDAEGSAAGNK